MEKIQEIAEKITGFKKAIPKSRNLARETEDLLDELLESILGFADIEEDIEALEALEETAGSNGQGTIADRIKKIGTILSMAHKDLDEAEEKKIAEGDLSVQDVAEIIESIIDQKPDAELRRQFETLTEELKKHGEKDSISVQAKLLSIRK